MKYSTTTNNPNSQHLLEYYIATRVFYYLRDSIVDFLFGIFFRNFLCIFLRWESGRIQNATTTQHKTIRTPNSKHCETKVRVLYLKSALYYLMTSLTKPAYIVSVIQDFVKYSTRCMLRVKPRSLWYRLMRNLPCRK